MELWSIPEVAELTNTSESFWRKQVQLRLIPVVKVGRLVRFRPDDVKAYFESRIRPAKWSGQ